MMEGTPRHTHKNPVVSTSVVSWAYSEQEYQILELGLPMEAWDPLPVRLKDWEGSGEVGFRRQNHRKSEGCCIPAVGKCSGWPTWPPSPQPLALLPVGGTAEGPHDPRVPPLPEAPGQSSCAGLKRRIPRISRECWMGVAVPTMATGGQSTSKELLTGYLHLGKQGLLPISGTLPGSIQLPFTGGKGYWKPWGLRRPHLWV